MIDKKFPSEDVGGIGLDYSKLEEVTDESSNRYYSFGIVTYDINADLCGFLENVVHYCYRIHDKDDTAPHYHIFFTVEKNMTCKNVVKTFKAYQADQTQNTFCRPVKKDNFACYEYLMHVHHPKKFQYTEDEIVTDDVTKWVKISRPNDVDSFIDDLFSETLNIREMCHKYGRDFMRNFKNYMYIREAVLYEDSKRKSD